MSKKNTQGKHFDFLNLAYGVGAAIVITGAMFKFLNWDYANEMFLVGLTTEVVVFLISGFEFKTRVSKPRWERIFPQIDPSYKGELKPLDLSELYQVYLEKTDVFSVVMDDLNKSVSQLTEVTQKISKRVDDLGTNLDNMQQSSIDYSAELDELKVRMKALNDYYDNMLVVGGGRSKDNG